MGSTECFSAGSSRIVHVIEIKELLVVVTLLLFSAFAERYYFGLLLDYLIIYHFGDTIYMIIRRF